MSWRLLLVVAMVIAAPGARGAAAAGKAVTIQGNKVLFGGQPVKLWGVRVGSAAASDEYAQQLVETLKFFKDHGVNTIAVSYQGSAGQVQRVFAADGKSFADTAARDRMRTIIEAAARRDMVVIVGLFHPRKMGTNSEDPRLESREAYVEATRTAATELKQYRNVILSVAHDAGRTAWAGAPIKFAPEDAVACLKAAAAAAPDLPRGCGGPEHDFNAAVAAAPEASVILHGERTPAPPAFREAKPVINVCLFGADAGGRDVQGVWPPQQRDRFAEAIARHLGQEAHHMVAHFPGWHEGGLDLRKNRFDVGGAGTTKDPGTAWYYQTLLRKVTPAAPAVVGGPAHGKPATRESIFQE